MAGAGLFTWPGRKMRKELKPFCFPCVLVLAFFLSSHAFALFYRGGTNGVGVRAMGLCGAFTSVAEDTSAAYWNPAGLAQLDHPEIMGMYGSYFNGRGWNLYFSAQCPLADYLHLAVSTNHLFYTDVPGTHEDQYTVSVALPLDFVSGKRLLFGGNFRYLFADLGAGTGVSRGAGADFGLLFRQPFPKGNELKIGLVINDPATTVRFDSTGVEQKVPPTLNFGMAYKFDPDTLITADAPWVLTDDTLPGSQNVRVRAGLERWLFDGHFGLRAGYIYLGTSPGEFSVGASVRTPDWSVNYALLRHSENMVYSHRFSASYSINAGPGIPDAKPYFLKSYVGDGKIYLSWDIPKGSKADGYMVYVRTDAETEFRSAKPEPLQTKYCLLRGAKNGVRYHLFIRSVREGKEKYSGNEWVATPKPMSGDAQKYYEAAFRDYQKNKMSSALYAVRQAEELDPNNFEIKDLIRRLETTHHEGLVPEAGGK
jgi:hypothetical protein